MENKGQECYDSPIFIKIYLKIKNIKKVTGYGNRSGWQMVVYHPVCKWPGYQNKLQRQYAIYDTQTNGRIQIIVLGSQHSQGKTCMCRKSRRKFGTGQWQRNSLKAV